MTGKPPTAQNRLGPYVLLGKLGQGGMGVVFLAKHISLDRQVALKCLFSNAGEEEHERFRREAAAAVAVQHPGLARLYDFGREGDHVYMAMEYVRGTNLKTLVDRDGKLPLERVVDLARQLLRALEACHAAGMIHRDIKPANIMLNEEGALKLMDLGLVHLPNRTLLTSEGQVMGTPRYWPPEMVLGTALDHRADLYQVGLVLHELLEGRPVNTGIPMHDLPRVITTRPPLPPPAMDGPLAPRMASLLSRLLELDPRSRFASARDAIAFLDRPASSGALRRPPSVVPGGASGNSPGTQERPAPRPVRAGSGVPDEPARRAASQRRTIGAGLVAVVIALAAWRLPDRSVHTERPASAIPARVVGTEPAKPPPSPASIAPARFGAAALDDLTRGLKDAVSCLRNSGLLHQLRYAEAGLSSSASEAERARTRAELNQQWRKLRSTSRFREPLEHFQKCAPSAWASPDLQPGTRSELLYRAMEIADLLSKLEYLGQSHGFDRGAFERPHLTPHAASHENARTWLAWTLGDGGRAAGRSSPPYLVSPQHADPVAAFSASDVGVLLTPGQKGHKSLELALASPPPRAAPRVHFAYRISGGSLGEKLLLNAIMPDGADEMTLAVLVARGGVVEGCVEVDARPLARARALRLKVHGRPLGSLSQGLILDHLVALVVPPGTEGRETR